MDVIFTICFHIKNSAFNPQCIHTSCIIFIGRALPLTGTVFCEADIGRLHIMYMNFSLQNNWVMAQALSCQPLVMQIQV